MPLVVHVLFRLDVGGLESVLVNLINDTPADRYRHAVVCLTDFSEFRERIRRPDTPVFALHKRPGKDPRVYWRLWKLLRTLRPAVVHTYNFAALDAVVAVALAGVPRRVHAEHGRDIFDLDGSNPRYIRIRRWLQPLFDCIVPVSRDLERWLIERVGIRPDKVLRIYNGVDVSRFHPPAGGRARLPGGADRHPDFDRDDSVVFGTVGRLFDVKNHANLIDAFALLAADGPEARRRLRLVVVGDGHLRDALAARVAERGLQDIVWMAGNRDDVDRIMAGFDVFVLPSLAEGIALTALEAMASGLPVVATRVGGNPELVTDAENGYLVPSADAPALAAALRRYLEEPGLSRRQGALGRQRVEREFSIDVMIASYLKLYDRLTVSAPVS